MRAIFSLLLVLAATSACSDAPSTVPEKTPVVKTALIGAAQGGNQLIAVGSVAARRELQLGFTTAGQIAALTVNEGDRVTKGQLLAALDMDQVAAGVDAAVAEERRARADYQRTSTLKEKGWVTQTRLDNARAALDAASANVRARRFAADTARIYAPSDGLILARLSEPREVVAAGSPVVVLAEQSGGFVLRAPLSDRQSVDIALGAPALVRLDAAPDRPLAGKVIEIGGQSDRATGAFQVEISLPNAPGLRSGLVGRVTIETQGTTTASQAAQLLLPAGALFSARAGEGFVFVIDKSNRARLRPVQLSETRDDGIYILSGLVRGDRVATSGLDLLRDGMVVRPVGGAQ